MKRGLVYRRARPEDLATCVAIWSSAIGDYLRRLSQPWFTGDPEPLMRLLGHFLSTDPERFWVAETDSRVVAFGSATQRGDAWFLGMLFVLPDYQAAGLGRQLLERLMPRGSRSGAAEDGSGGSDREGGAMTGAPAMGTAADSLQPISSALYGRYGLVPRLPVFQFVGRPTSLEALGGPPSGVRISEITGADASASGPELDAVDRVSLGRAHPQDHAFLRAEGRRLFVARSEQGPALGYGYIAPSGRFGPIAATGPGLLAPIAGHLLSTVRVPGAYASWIPGAADQLFTGLLRAGLRIESFPAMLLWDRPLADFSRYVPINLALL